MRPHLFHYHIAVVQKGKRVLTSQLYLAGEPQNERDGFSKVSAMKPSGSPW